MAEDTAPTLSIFSTRSSAPLFERK
jgi:hypothetical protein